LIWELKMYDTRFTAASFAEKRDTYDTVLNWTPGSVARGLREMADSVEAGETLMDGFKSSDEVNGNEFAKVSLTLTYVYGDFTGSPKYLYAREAGKPVPLLSWWGEVGRFKFKRRQGV
jgi:hypothetical protein